MTKTKEKQSTQEFAVRFRAFIDTKVCKEFELMLISRRLKRHVWLMNKMQEDLKRFKDNGGKDVK
jgi:hypothetical protein